MKRSPLKRKTPIRRTRMKVAARKSTDDPAYLDRVRRLPCCARFLPGHSCAGPVVAHHAGRHGVGQRCPDREAIPLCSLAHTCLHDFKGSFTFFTRASMRDWENAAIATTQAALGVPLTVSLAASAA